MSNEKENKIIAAIILAKAELKILKLKCGPASVVMVASTSAQYVAQVNLMRQNGATFTDILTMLTGDKNEQR